MKGSTSSYYIRQKKAVRMLTKHVSNLRRHLPLWFISLPVFTNNLQIAEHLFRAEESSQSQTFFSSFVLAQRGSMVINI